MRTKPSLPFHVVPVLGSDICCITEHKYCKRYGFSSSGATTDEFRSCRGGEKPDGVCCVVGSMASGFPEEVNKSSDLIYSHSHITGSPEQADSNLQYFWEAFPAGTGPTCRTTYMFAYMDAGASSCGIISRPLHTMLLPLLCGLVVKALHREHNVCSM